MENVIVIVGPTASGKTKLSIALAKELSGEIISADSMQIYKYMDIGTAKPTIEEREGIKHYLMDEVLPSSDFSVAQFKTIAYKYIEQILKKGKTPIVVGGTGLYINSLIYNIEFSKTNSDLVYRKKLQDEALDKGNEYLYNRLKNVDAKTAQKLHLNDTKRIIRALEVFHVTGNTISYYNELSKNKCPKYNFIIMGLNVDRQVLYERINLRVEKMLDEGLLKEVEKLVDLGYDKYCVPMQGIGYKEMLSFMNGEVNLNEAVDMIKKATRRYAKRQNTWFKRLDNAKWFDATNNLEKEKIIQNIKYDLATSKDI